MIFTYWFTVVELATFAFVLTPYFVQTVGDVASGISISIFGVAYMITALLAIMCMTK